MSPLTDRIQKRWRKSLAWLQGWWRASFILPWCRLTRKPIADISFFQRKVPFIERREYSQNGEDGIIAAIFAVIGVTNKYCVEFGVEDGMECNTRYLLKHGGWHGLLMDGRDNPPESGVKKEFITAENINGLFRKYGVPEAFDLLSIDIDGNDYWVWKAIVDFRPRVVIVEYNGCIPFLPAVTVPYDPSFAWDGTAYYGASLSAFAALGRMKGYTLLGTDRNGVNAFFILDELVPGNFSLPPLEHRYHPAAFKGIPGKKHPADPLERPWVSVEG